MHFLRARGLGLQLSPGALGPPRHHTGGTSGTSRHRNAKGDVHSRDGKARFEELVDTWREAWTSLGRTDIHRLSIWSDPDADFQVGSVLPDLSKLNAERNIDGLPGVVSKVLIYHSGLECNNVSNVPIRHSGLEQNHTSYTIHPLLIWYSHWSLNGYCCIHQQKLKYDRTFDIPYIIERVVHPLDVVPLSFVLKYIQEAFVCYSSIYLIQRVSVLLGSERYVCAKTEKETIFRRIGHRNRNWYEYPL